VGCMGQVLDWLQVPPAAPRRADSRQSAKM